MRAHTHTQTYVHLGVGLQSLFRDGEKMHELVAGAHHKHGAPRFSQQSLFGALDCNLHFGHLGEWVNGWVVGGRSR